MSSLRSRAPREASEWKAKKFLWVSLAVTTGSIIFFFALRVVFPTIKEEAKNLQSLGEQVVGPESTWQKLKYWGGFTVRTIDFEWRTPAGKDPMLQILKNPLERVVKDLDVLKGQNLFTLDLNSAKEKVRSSGWVDGVSIRREIPGRVHITAHLREPRFLIRADGAWIVADQSGHFMFRQKEIPGWLVDLPLIFGWEGQLARHISLPELERGLQEERESLREAHELVFELENKLRVKIESLTISFDSWLDRPRFQVVWQGAKNSREVRVILLSGAWKNRIRSLQALLSEPLKGDSALEVDGQRADRWIVRGGSLN